MANFSVIIRAYQHVQKDYTVLRLQKILVEFVRNLALFALEKLQINAIVALQENS